MGECTELGNQQSMGSDREGRGKVNAQIPTPGMGSNGGIVHEMGTLGLKRSRDPGGSWGGMLSKVWRSLLGLQTVPGPSFVINNYLSMAWRKGGVSPGRGDGWMDGWMDGRMNRWMGG